MADPAPWSFAFALPFSPPILTLPPAPTGEDVDHGVAARIAGAAVAGQGLGIDQTGGDIAGAGIEPDGGKGVGIPQRVDTGDRARRWP